MITSQTVYWVTRLDGFKNMSAILGVLTLVLGLFLVIPICIDVYENRKSNYFLSVLLIPLFGLFFIIASIFIPNTKEMCAILIIPKMANSETIKELGTDALEIKNLAVDYLKEKMTVKK